MHCTCSHVCTIVLFYTAVMGCTELACTAWSGSPAGASVANTLYCLCCTCWVILVFNFNECFEGIQRLVIWLP